MEAGSSTQDILCPVAAPGIPPFSVYVGRAEATGKASYGADPISEQLVRSGTVFSQDLIDLMLALTRPGQLVVDLGAHIGLFTLAAAAAGRRALAVEASRRNQDLLARSIEANSFGAAIELVCAAASNKPGTLCFAEAGPFGSAVNKAAETAPPVPAVRVGDLLASRPGPVGLIKIDVEGFEIEAIEGMADWLRACSRGCSQVPPLLYESHHWCHELSGRTVRDLQELLRGLGYRHHYLVTGPNRLTPLRPSDTQPILVGECLATAAPLAVPPGWTVTGPMTPREFLALAAAELNVYREMKAELAALGRGFCATPSHLVRDLAVRLFLRQLSQDPDAEVRKAFARWASPGTPGEWAEERLHEMRTALKPRLQTLARRLLRVHTLPGKVIRRIKRMAG
jgi:FkbM family methyltransferase